MYGIGRSDSSNTRNACSYYMRGTSIMARDYVNGECVQYTSLVQCIVHAHNTCSIGNISTTLGEPQLYAMD